MIRRRWLALLIPVGALACAQEPVAPAPPPSVPKPVQYPQTPQYTEPEPVAPPVTAPPAKSPSSIKGKKIVIDAGHGGKDVGTRGVSSMWEKDIALDIAQEVARLLRSQGASVEMTRSTDRFIELEDRAKVAERLKAAVLVSIHADSAKNTSASGATVYHSRSPSAESKRIAFAMNDALKRGGVNTRGINQANFKVLVEHTRPAILVECGYLTNRTDASKLNTASYRDKVAAAIAAGIVDALGA